VTVIVLLGVLLLAVMGCVCVFWDARGGAPRWVRVVAVVTLMAGEILEHTKTHSRRNRDSGE
jgi:hypothetical protein